MPEPRPAAVEVTFASPLSLLLEEERIGDRQAEQVLLLSYTTDLSFVETTVLGVAHATGAAVSVVGDAAMTTVNPRAVRRAGRTYLTGLTHLAGAFHPKLVLIAGPERATVAIGSGNVTLAGWQANAELWTVLRGSHDAGCPAAFAALATWLSALPGAVRAGPGVADALSRASAVLADLVGRSPVVAEQVRLATNLTVPLLDQLPDAPVEELNVYAPFHDRDARALSELRDRMRPQRWSLAWQPGLTDLDSDAVADLLGRFGGQLLADGESRYRHGKLIEWVDADGRRSALVGSANLSGPALLSTPVNGGNVELGLQLPVFSSLMPPTVEQPPGTVRTAPAVPRPPRASGPLLLGALRVEEGIEVMLAHPLQRPARLQLSQASLAPELWEQIGIVDPGELRQALPVAAEPGSRLRLVVDVDGLPKPGNTVFLLDLARASSRPGSGLQHARPTTLGELFDDPDQAERFAADLAAFRSALPAVPPSSAPSAASGRDVTLSGELGWQRYLDEAAGRLGMPLLRFALGLPDAPRSDSADALDVTWVDDLSDDALAATDDDTTEQVDDADDTAARQQEHAPDLGLAPHATRRRYQRWAERLTEVTPGLGLPERMLAVRLLLRLVAARAWTSADREWVALLATATGTLGTGELPRQAEAAVGSLAALAVSVLRSEGEGVATTEQTLAYRRARQAVEHLLPAADDEHLQVYAGQLGSAFGPAANPELVLALASELVQGDVVAAAVHALGDRGRDVHQHHGPLMHVVGSFSAPARIGVEAVVAATDAEVVGAWVGRPSGRWALVMWRRPDLVLIERAGDQTLWRHVAVPSRLSLGAVLTTDGIDSRYVVRHGPLVNSFALAEDLLGDLGLSDPQPPHCF